MNAIVSAIAMSHAPLVLGDPDAPAPAVKARMDRAAIRLQRLLRDSRPDVIVAFLDDHFENHFRRLMPSLSIGVATHHVGPAQQWLEALRIDRQFAIPGAPELAEHLLRTLVPRGFDLARSGQVEYGNNLMVPLMQLWPDCDIPIVPVFINVFSPPLISTKRAHAFGAAVAHAIESFPGNQRIALLATGGLSHWPPIWTDTSPEADAFLTRMKRFQTEGLSILQEDPDLLSDLGRYEIDMARANQYPLNSDHPLVNAAWDRRFLQALVDHDLNYLLNLSYDDIQREAGHGGHEILNWLALLGAVGQRPATLVDYEAVIEWICGMGYVYFDMEN